MVQARRRGESLAVIALRSVVTRSTGASRIGNGRSIQIGPSCTFARDRESADEVKSVGPRSEQQDHGQHQSAGSPPPRSEQWPYPSHERTYLTLASSRVDISLSHGSTYVNATRAWTISR